MDISLIVTGVVGLAGVAGSITGVIVGNRSESFRSLNAEKRRVFVRFNASIEDLWIISTSSDDFTSDSGRSRYNDALRQLWGASYEVKLIASDPVSELATSITKMMQDFGNGLIQASPAQRKKMALNGPADDFDETREKLIDLMYSDLSGRRATLRRPAGAPQW